MTQATENQVDQPEDAPSEEVSFSMAVPVLTPDQLEKAVQTWRGLLEEAGKDADGNVLSNWQVTWLGVSSLDARFLPLAEKPDVRNVVLRHVQEVVTSVGSPDGVLTNKRYEKPVRALLTLAESAPLTVEVLGKDIQVTPEATVQMQPALRSVGSITGRILTVSTARGLTCVLYDDLHGRGVTCRLPREMKDVVLDAFDHRALVAGMISRNPSSGLASLVSEVTSITKIEYEKGDYRKARGLFEPTPGSLKPEELIRKIRDAS